MLRLAIIILTASTSMIQAASADEVHHTSFADAVVGTWAQRPELCGTTDKSNITIAAKEYSTADDKCSVETVVERAGEPGPIYSALARCTDAAGKARAAYLIVRTEAKGGFSIGSTLNDLKPYQRCPK
jgi:hypothetical protein